MSVKSTDFVNKLFEVFSRPSSVKGKVISDISFDAKYDFSKLDLTGVTFERCQFNWSLFTQEQLERVRFKNCKFNHSCFLSSHINNCQFEECLMLGVIFSGAEITRSSFERSKLAGCSFEDAQITDSVFKQGQMPGTHFLQAKVRNTHILECDLTDTIFFGTEDDFVIDEISAGSHRITKPITSILIIPEEYRLSIANVIEKLEQYTDTIPILVNAYPALLDPEEVKKEVENALNDRSTPKALMEDGGPKRNEILKKAQALARYVDGFVLPGGEDIPAKLSGESEAAAKDWESGSFADDYRRSLLEFAIIKESLKKGIPLTAICRGFQISHLYFGAKLQQHIPGHLMVRQKYQLVSRDHQGIFGEWNSRDITFISAHHQGITAGSEIDYVEPSIVFDGVLKAGEAKYSGSAPLLLTQFHPELSKIYPSYIQNKLSRIKESLFNRFGINNEVTRNIAKTGEQFWAILKKNVSTYNQKKRVLAEFSSL